MKLHAWFRSEAGVMAVGAALTLLVLAESIFPPWAPYFVAYALLALIIPLAAKTYPFGSFRAVLRSQWKLILGIFAAAILVDEGLVTWLYQRILDRIGVGENPFYSLNAAIVVMADAAARKFNISRDAALGLYAGFILIWAPVGEELFYRGYMQEVLRQSRNFATAALISATFFSLRHATHLCFLWPDVPWAAAASWVVSTFVFGLLMSYLYERTHSLYPVILVHFGLNVAELALS